MIRISHTDFLHPEGSNSYNKSVSSTINPQSAKQIKAQAAVDCNTVVPAVVNKKHPPIPIAAGKNSYTQATSNALNSASFCLSQDIALTSGTQTNALLNTSITTVPKETFIQASIKTPSFGETNSLALPLASTDCLYSQYFKTPSFSSNSNQNKEQPIVVKLFNYLFSLKNKIAFKSAVAGENSACVKHQKNAEHTSVRPHKHLTDANKQAQPQSTLQQPQAGKNLSHSNTQTAAQALIQSVKNEEAEANTVHKNTNKHNHKKNPLYQKDKNAPANFKEIQGKLTKNNKASQTISTKDIPAKYFAYYLYLLSLLGEDKDTGRENKEFSFSKSVEKVSDKASTQETKNQNSLYNKTQKSNTQEAHKQNKGLKKHKKTEIAKYYYTLSLLAKSPLNNFVERFSDNKDHKEVAERLKNTCILVDYIEQEGVSHSVMKDFMKVHFDYFGNYHQDALSSFRALKGNVETQKQFADKVIHVLESYRKKDNNDKDNAVKKLEKTFKQYGLQGSNDFKAYIDYLEHINIQNNEINKDLLNSVKQKSEKCDLNTLLEFICRYKNYGIYIEHLHEFVALDKEIKNNVYKRFVDLHKNEPKMSAGIQDSARENLQIIKANEDFLDAPSKRQVKQINTDTCNTVEKLQQHLALDAAVNTANKLNNADGGYLAQLEKNVVLDSLEDSKKDYKWYFGKDLSEDEIQALFAKIYVNSKKTQNNNLREEGKNLTAKDIINKVVYLNDLEHAKNSVHKKAQKTLSPDLYKVKKQAFVQTEQKQDEKQKVLKQTKNEQFKIKEKEQLGTLKQTNDEPDKQNKTSERTQQQTQNTTTNANTIKQSLKRSTVGKNPDEQSQKEQFEQLKQGLETSSQPVAFKDLSTTQKTDNKNQKSKKTNQKAVQEETDNTAAPVFNVAAGAILPQNVKNTKTAKKSVPNRASERNDKKSKIQNDTTNSNYTAIQMQTIIKLNQILNQELNTKYGKQNKEALEQYITQIQFKRYQTEQKAADDADDSDS